MRMQVTITHFVATYYDHNYVIQLLFSALRGTMLYKTGKFVSCSRFRNSLRISLAFRIGDKERGMKS